LKKGFHFLLFVSLLFGFEVTNWQIYPTYQWINQIAEKGETIYLATNGGLLLISREGKIFKNYTYQDGLLSHYCQSFAWDREGNLWIATNYRGVLIRRREGFLLYPPERIPSSVRKIIILGDTVVLGTNEGVYFINTRGSFLQPDSHIITNIIRGYIAYSLFSDTFFWVGTGRGIFRASKDLQEIKSYSSPVGDSIKGFIAARETVFICGERGIAYYDQTIDSFFPYFFFPSTLIIYDFQFSNGKFYIASGQGTFIYDGTNFYSLYGDYTTAILLRDYILLGIRGPDNSSGYLVKIEGGEMKAIRFPTIIANCIFSIAKDSEGDIYLSHFFWGGGSLTILSPDTIIPLKDTLPVPDRLVIDPKNRVWVGHWSENGGLSCYDKVSKTWEIFQWGTQTPKNVIGALNIDQKGTKWVWNGIGSLVALDSQRISYEFSIPGLGQCLRGREITFDSKGRVYLGTPNGLLLFDHKGTLSNLSDDTAKILTEGLLSANILSVACDSRDRVWVATPKGLGLLEGERFRVWRPENSGLVSDNCLRLTVDPYDQVWILTEGGLSIYNPQKDSWRSFTPANSPILPNWKNILEFYLSLLVDKSNAYIGTRDGLIVISYKEEVEKEKPLSFTIYPNPLLLDKSSSGRLNIAIENGQDLESMKVEIFTLRGKKVKIKEIEKNKTGFTIEIDKSFSSGFYLLQVREENYPYRSGLGRFVILR
jgi:streptogramin lyase